MTKYFILAALVAIFSNTAWAKATSCDYYAEVEPGIPQYVFNPEYPKPYTGERSCSWYAKSATNLELICEEFSLPASNYCAGDRVSISPTGNVKLTDALNYCGTGTFHVTSTGNSMNIVLTAFNGTEGGRFLCRIEATAAIIPDCECGWKKETRIVGGTTAGTNEFPMMAGLVDSHLKLLYCGATIISTKHAVTAAHCYPNSIDVDKLGLVVGEHDVSTGAETNATRLYRVSHFLSHPLYNNDTRANDIAVVTVIGTIRFSAEVGPACLPFQYVYTSFNGAIVDVLGWGTLEFAGEKSDVLQKVKLNVVDISRCQRAFPNVTTNQLCTFTPGKDVCQFDSGGPLLWQNPDTMRLYLAGVISYGAACADSAPSVDTRVAPYLKWIVSVTPGANYCQVQ